jgi:DNA-binding NtrC family response regulator
MVTTTAISKARILVIDDESSMSEFMRIMLEREGYYVTAETSAHTTLKRLKQSQGDPKDRYNLLITDLMMPEMSGLEILTEAKKIDPELGVIVMTAFGSIDTAVEALKKGASDYVTKPFKVDEIKISIKKAIEQKQIRRQNIALKETLATGFESFIGGSESILKVKTMAAKAAATDVNVLITGESGTGKEVLSRAIHTESRRKSGPFLTINCAALPESLLESELFGHMKGSFTGAVKDKIGLFAAAVDGTFFLDEIGETSQAIQAKLLRVLEEKELTPVGATEPIPVDVRVIAATNARLREMVDHGAFRADLYYRLDVFTIDIPPLRQRPDDIELLATHFLRRHSAKLNIPERTIAAEAMKLLKSYSWPGNIRQLENVLERTVMLTKNDNISIEDLPEEIRQSTKKIGVVRPESMELNPNLETMEKAYIHYTLHQTGWNKGKAAKILGIDLSTLYRKIDRYSLPKKP